MNPARSLAPAVVAAHLGHVWLYLIAPVLGAAAAVPCWWATRGRGAIAEPAVEAVRPT